MSIITFYTDCKKLDMLAHHSIVTFLVKNKPTAPIFIDATAGNGYDTCFLAQIAKKDDIVLAFDIQKQALNNTYKRLCSNRLEHRVKLIMASHGQLHKEIFQHHRLKKYIPSLNSFQYGICCVIMFNLGFLPGSNKQLTTTIKSTLLALNDAVYLLALGGVISIHCYTGHPGGLEETEAIFYWSKSLSREQYDVLTYSQINKQKNNEHLMIITRRLL